MCFQDISTAIGVRNVESRTSQMLRPSAPRWKRMFADGIQPKFVSTGGAANRPSDPTKITSDNSSAAARD